MATQPQAQIPVFKNEPVLVLVLGLVTCGLYLIYWNIKMAEVLNAASGRNLISLPIAALAGCCWPVNVYYYYLAGEGLRSVGEKVGRPELKDKQTLLLILGFLIPQVAAMIVQGHVNELYAQK